MKRITLILALLAVSGCAPTSSDGKEKYPSGFQVTYNTDGQKTSIQKMDLQDGTTCYAWYGEFSCLKR